MKNTILKPGHIYFTIDYFQDDEENEEHIEYNIYNIKSILIDKSYSDLLEMMDYSNSTMYKQESITIIYNPKTKYNSLNYQPVGIPLVVPNYDEDEEYEDTDDVDFTEIPDFPFEKYKKMINKGTLEIKNILLKNINEK